MAWSTPPFAQARDEAAARSALYPRAGRVQVAPMHPFALRVLAGLVGLTVTAAHKSPGAADTARGDDQGR